MHPSVRTACMPVADRGCMTDESLQCSTVHSACTVRTRFMVEVVLMEGVQFATPPLNSSRPLPRTDPRLLPKFVSMLRCVLEQKMVRGKGETIHFFGWLDALS